MKSPAIDSLSAELNEALRLRTVPPVGLHRDVSEDVYHNSWDAQSHSSLMEMQYSPMHYRYRRQHPTEETDAQRRGRAIHTALLEMHHFPKRFVRGPAGNWTLKANRAKVDELRAKWPDATVMHEEEYDDIMRARDTVLQHPTAKLLFEGATDFEISAVWDHADVDIRCKARADFIRPDIGAILDLKKTVRATPRAFARSASEYWYTLQAAFYLDGFNAVFDPTIKVFETFAFIAIEDTPPHGVSIFELRPEDIAAGRVQYLRLLRRAAECLKTGEWPSYPSEIQYLELPDYTRERE